MMKVKLISMMLFIVLCCTAIYADYIWNDNAIGDHSWNNPGNWTPGVPTNAAPSQIDRGDPNGAVIDASVSGENAAIARHLYVAKASGASGALYMEQGGELTISYDFLMGDSSGSEGHFNMSGGTVSIGRYPRWGGYGSAYATITGGTINSPSSNEFYIGLRSSGYGEVNMSGGLMNIAKHLRIGHQGPGKFVLSNVGELAITGNIEVSTTSTGDGEFIADGGLINCQDVYPGYEGVGSFTVNDGVVNINQKAIIGLRSTASGSEMIINGGTVNMPGINVGANGLRVGNEGSGVLTVNGGELNVGADLAVPFYSTQASGHINLTGGVISTRILNVQEANGSIDFAGGTMIIDGDISNTINDLVVAGNITAYDGRSSIVVDYDSLNAGKTTVYALSVDLEQAWNPSPVNGTNEAAFHPVLSWSAGDNAVSHNVYFGTDEVAVTNADVSVFMGNQAATSFDPGQLLPGMSYYWRIDEVQGDSSIVSGMVWTFAVAQFTVLDDFEQYQDTASLQGVWGSNVQLEDTVAIDQYSMSLAYNNAASEDETMVSKALGGFDLTANGMESFNISYHGSPENQADLDLFIELTDASSNTARVVYSSVYSLPQLLIEPWQQWNVAYSEFTDVNGSIDLANIQTISLGVKGQDSGTVYFDDIRLYIPRCIPAMVEESFNGDCVADNIDFSIFANYWNSSASVITSQVPQNSPILYYNFDQTSGTSVTDMAGDNDGTASVSSLWDTDGVVNGCVSFDGTSFITVPAEALKVTDSNDLLIENEVTISFWVNADAENITETQYLFHGSTENYTGHIIAGTVPALTTANDAIEFHSGHITPQDPEWPYYYWGWDAAEWTSCKLADYAKGWNHYAFTKDAANGVIRIYKDGMIVYQAEDAFVTMIDLDNMVIGCFDRGYAKALFYKGKLDEFKVFDYALGQSEILSLAGYTQGQNVSVFEDIEYDLDNNGEVGISDISFLVNNWLSEQLWPAD